GSLVADDRGSIVPTPIVDHEDLIVLSEQRQGGVRLGDRFPNARRLVAGGQDQAQFPGPAIPGPLPFLEDPLLQRGDKDGTDGNAVSIRLSAPSLETHRPLLIRGGHWG